MKNEHQQYMREAIRLAFEGMRNGNGGPFGAVVVKNGEIIGRGSNMVTATNDPTAHAEIMAIRDACRNLEHFQLEDCVIYSSCEPCPMCLGAIYWARPKQIFYACSKEDAGGIEFDDDFIYEEFAKKPANRKILAEQLLREEGIKAFEEWDKMENKELY